MGFVGECQRLVGDVLQLGGHGVGGQRDLDVRSRWRPPGALSGGAAGDEEIAGGVVHPVGLDDGEPVLPDGAVDLRRVRQVCDVSSIMYVV